MASASDRPDAPDWLEYELAQFATGLRWVLERKDFNDFWPIGIPSSSKAGAVVLLEAMDLRTTALAAPRNPTAAALLYLYAIHGMRELNWPQTDRVRAARAILQGARSAKESAVFSLDGSHRLRSPLADWAVKGLDPVSGHWSKAATSSRSYIRRVHELCAVTWAFAEAACYFNHRILTERHGPYPSSQDDSVTLIRSAYDLDVTDYWPELDQISIPIKGFEAASTLPHSTDPWFDMFANPIFNADVAADVSQTLLLVKTADSKTIVQPPLDLLDDTILALQNAIRLLLAQTSRMSPDERTRKVFRVMATLSTRLGLCGSDVVPPLGWEYSGPRQRVIARPAHDYSQAQLTRYYDIRSDAPPRH